YFLLTPQLGQLESERRLSPFLFGLLVGLSIGFYDGFLGPGTGSFFCLAYILLAGLTLTKATAHAKVLNFTSNVAALLFFIISGQVVWLVGLTMLLGQLIGARLGAGMVLNRGQRLIRPMMIFMSIVMSLKLLYDNHGQQLSQWLNSLL